MPIHIKVFFTVLVAFLILDSIWLGWLARDFYVSHMGDMMNMEDGKVRLNYVAAALVYVLLAAGVVAFPLARVSAETPTVSVFFWGCLLGAVIYGVYDMTNKATLKEWPLVLITIDVLWGAVVCGTVTVIGRWARDGVFAA